MKRVAIVILNWNGNRMLRRFLPSVLRHSNPDDATVYVADNSSTDGSVDMLHREFPDIRVIEFDRNYGFAGGYNMALEKIKEEYVVLLNSDVEVSEAWLEPLIAYMDVHPEVAACQPKIRSWHDKERFEYAGAAGGFLDAYGYPFCRGRIMHLVEKDNGQYDTIVPVFWATGAALFIRLNDYLHSGGLDGRFFAHMEEIDLCWRLRARGRGVVCVPQSTVCHVGGATLKRESPRKTFLNFRNNLLMLYKNLPEKDLVRVMRVRMFLDCLAAFFFVLKGQFSNAGAVFEARKEFRSVRGNYIRERTENLEKMIVDSIPEQMKNCILAEFYVKGKRAFSQLLFN
ncbi:MAG: glycosyltransferase family 2 protein [Mediterranea sp.]|nr:glycosyltransferase family 2 protein [Mediterranea sp.]